MAKSDKTDYALVLESREGTLGAFDELMERYQRLVCKVAMNYVKERQNALDVTQNVFLKIYEHLGSVNADGMFKPWLLRITYNESINWIRKRKRLESHEPLENHDELSADPEDGQEAAVARKEHQGLLLEGMARLNPKYRLAVSLRYAEGMRIREIADVMGCSEGVVKSVLFRSLRQIKKNVASSTGWSGGPE